METIIKFLSVLIFSLFFCACAVPHSPKYEVNGKKYGITGGNFTGQWYDYYYRALSYADGGYYKDALSDLRAAIERRPADKRWANTYGIHFTDYFPHREAGIACYFMKDYDTAESELELSIRQEPSDKALFYLDQVRRRIMEQKKQDTGKPDIRVIYPLSCSDIPGAGECDEIRTADDPVILSGLVTDERYVSKIFLGDTPLFLEKSGQEIFFRETLDLEQGMHHIEIRARNLLGGETERRIMLYVDRAGPVIVIKRFVPGIEIQGYVYDKSGVRHFFAESSRKQEAVLFQADGFFMLSLKPGMTDINLTATDILGNQTRAVITLPVIPEKTSSDRIAKEFPLLFAENVSDADPVPDLRGFQNPTGLPEIRLKDWTDTHVVLKKRVDIAGQINGKTDIESVSIQIEYDASARSQAESWERAEIGAWEQDMISVLHHSGGVGISFNQSVNLRSGKNTISITAKDTSGRTAIKKIYLIRKIPAVFYPAYRYTVKMYPFDNTECKSVICNESGGLLQRFVSKIPAWLSHSVMKKEKCFQFQYLLAGNLTARHRFQITWHEALEELATPEFQTPNLTSGFPVHSLLLGNTYQDRNGTEIIARLVDIKTSEIIAVKDAYAPAEDTNSLKTLADRLSEKFHRTFPLVSGTIRITDKNRASFETDEMQNKAQNRVLQGWPLIIYREQVTGKSPVSDPEIIADGVMGHYKTVIINEHNINIRTGDRVITR